MDKKQKILIILEILFLAGQTFIHVDYVLKNSTRYDYKDFMNQIKDYIKTHNLNENYYMNKFKEVFNDYFDSTILYSTYNNVFVAAIQLMLWILSIVGIIYNFNSHKKNIPIVFFSYALIVGFLQLIISIGNETSELNLKESDLKELEGVRTLIETNLNSVKKRIFYLNIYSLILTVIFIFHLILSVYIKKSSNNTANINIPLENSEQNNLVNNYN